MDNTMNKEVVEYFAFKLLKHATKACITLGYFPGPVVLTTVAVCAGNDNEVQGNAALKRLMDFCLSLMHEQGQEDLANELERRLQ